MPYCVGCGAKKPRNAEGWGRSEWTNDLYCPKCTARTDRVIDLQENYQAIVRRTNKARRSGTIWTQEGDSLTG